MDQLEPKDRKVGKMGDRVLYVSIPIEFANLLKVEKGTMMTMVYDPDRASIRMFPKGPAQAPKMKKSKFRLPKHVGESELGPEKDTSQRASRRALRDIKNQLIEEKGESEKSRNSDSLRKKMAKIDRPDVFYDMKIGEAEKAINRLEKARELAIAREVFEAAFLSSRGAISIFPVGRDIYNRISSQLCKQKLESDVQPYDDDSGKLTVTPLSRLHVATIDNRPPTMFDYIENSWHNLADEFEVLRELFEDIQVEHFFENGVVQSKSPWFIHRQFDTIGIFDIKIERNFYYIYRFLNQVIADPTLMRELGFSQLKEILHYHTINGCLEHCSDLMVLIAGKVRSMRISCLEDLKQERREYEELRGSIEMIVEELFPLLSECLLYAKDYFHLAFSSFNRYRTDGSQEGLTRLANLIAQKDLRVFDFYPPNVAFIDKLYSCRCSIPAHLLQLLGTIHHKLERLPALGSNVIEALIDILYLRESMTMEAKNQ